MAKQPDDRQALGRLGEDRAAHYLAKAGYAILARNWRVRRGELDIVARDGGWLVFVEVRARRAAQDGGIPVAGQGEESVTRAKQLRLISLAQTYLHEHAWDGPWRIDVIALDLRADGGVQRLAHYRDAVEG